MAKENTKRYSLAELKTLNAEKKYTPTRSDAPAYELDAEFWDNAHVVFPAVEGKEPVKIRIDREILSFFKSQGKGYQTRMNAVLRAYVEAQKKNLTAKENNKESA
ncbi:MAG: BrnA antitoxin family protein [Rhodospirillales bacterium]|jgi:uncharacterized protein (DUF4415 family)|nr:BrnA antitoxin family protein [Rhodospirillales bacterium]